MNQIYLLLLASCTLFAYHTAHADLIDQISKGAENLKNKVSDMTKSDSFDLNVCVTNDNCNKSFFKLQNYCCGLQCCDWFTYVFRDK
jgi:hypothetical protein